MSNFHWVISHTQLKFVYNSVDYFIIILFVYINYLISCCYQRFVYPLSTIFNFKVVL